MNKFNRLIQRITFPHVYAKEDVFDDIMKYWTDVSSGISVDEELAEELGVTPVALQELLDIHRHTFDYANIGGNSSVRGYDHGNEWMVVEFSDGTRYLYTVKSTSPESIAYMKELAQAGKGLNSYIMRLQRENYAGRNVKGEILIKPGMEKHNPFGYQRLELIVAFRNTIHACDPFKISGESFMQETLTKYKEQITTAGTDGLDPTARKIMSVGLESIGISPVASLESHDDATYLSSTANLEETVTRHLT